MDATHSSENSSSTSEKISFLDRYIYIRNPHNRISRGTYFVNCLLLVIFTSIISRFFGENIIISLVLLFFISVQTIKRLHDCNKSGWWILVFFAYILCIEYGPAIYFLFTGAADFSTAYLNWFFLKFQLLMETFGLFNIIYFLPFLALLLIPGNPEENQFGKPWKV